MRRRGHIVAAGFSVLLGYWSWGSAGAATAQEYGAQSRFHLSYRAPEGCPSEAEFAQLVSAQVGGPWLAEASEFAGILSVTVRQEGTGYLAHLVIAASNGFHGFERRHQIEDCRDLVAATAFSAVSAIDYVRTRHPDHCPRCRPCPRPPPSDRPPIPKELQPHPEVGIGGGRALRLGPSGAWGGSAFVGYRWPVARWSTRLGAEYWDTGWGTIAEARVRTSLSALYGDLCPFELQPMESLAFPLCLRGEMGVHSLRAQSPTNGEMTTSSGPWVSVGPLLQARVRGWGAFIEAGGGVSFPFYRATIRSRATENDVDSEVQYQAAVWTAFFTLGVGWEFF